MSVLSAMRKRVTTSSKLQN